MTKESNLGDHIKNKAHVYNLVNTDRPAFIAFLQTTFPGVASAIPLGYHPSQYRLVILYCSQAELKPEYKNLAPEVKYLWYGSIRYFRSITNTVRLSARHEVSEFLGIPYTEVGNGGVLPSGSEAALFSGSLLPEAHSSFPLGYKVVSFYVNPGALLQRAYVLRKDGWQDETGLYQRMIDRDKVESIRKYLRTEHRTFVNNVIITLPDDTKLIDDTGNTIDPSKITKTEPVKIQLPLTANCVGIVDGQHRIFSYYEDVHDDQQIATFRLRQNMLATGILYPAGLSLADRSSFEAGLFLEINSTQNSAKSDLKQAIAVITAPFSPDSIGKRVVGRLSSDGLLAGMLERHFFDKGVLKTTSIISFGVRALVRVDGEASLIKVWSHNDKSKVVEGKSVDALLAYVVFCSTSINTFLGAARARMGPAAWAVKATGNQGVLSVTSVNGLLILMRKIVLRDGLLDFDGFKERLACLRTFNFAYYKSSQYNRMADDMLAACSNQ